MTILGRAWTELKDGDWTLAILLSAMAVECDLAYLFMKWNKEDLLLTRTPDDADREKWEEQWRKAFAITAKLDKVSALVAGLPFDSFLAQNSGLWQDIQAKYPVSTKYPSPKEFFDKEFFRKRNKIVHFGEIDFQQPDAEMCNALARMLFRILGAMDDERRALNAKHPPSS
jgi:hypothetical protein